MKKSTVKKVSNQIGIEVLTRYQAEYSDPELNKYLFAYRIKITNQSKDTVQLLTRKWFIFDSTGKQTLVEGEGVIGKTPVLHPGETFEYVSCCPLESPIGYMHGEYEFKKSDSGEGFQSKIPKFDLVCPDVLN